MNAIVIPTGCVITGTDTQVGKTSISEALLQWCTGQGWLSAGFKPGAAGAQVFAGELVNDEVRRQREASSLSLTDTEVGQSQFAAACASNVAADFGPLAYHSRFGPATDSSDRTVSVLPESCATHGRGDSVAPSAGAGLDRQRDGVPNGPSIGQPGHTAP